MDWLKIKNALLLQNRIWLFVQLEKKKKKKKKELQFHDIKYEGKISKIDDWKIQITKQIWIKVKSSK